MINLAKDDSINAQEMPKKCPKRAFGWLHPVLIALVSNEKPFNIEIDTIPRFYSLIMIYKEATDAL